MAEPQKEEGGTSRPAAATPVFVPVLPASGAAADSASEREESDDESTAGTAIASEAGRPSFELLSVSPTHEIGGIPIEPAAPMSQTREIKDAMDRTGAIQEIHPEPEAEENATTISEEILAKAMNKLQPKRYESTQVPTIYKVPDGLKGGVGNHKYYRPVTVYLGCFLCTGHERHHYNKLEEYKWRCVRHLIDQLGSGNEKDVLRSCMECMNRLLPKVLASYSQDIKVVNIDEIAEQMLLDGCFILRHLLMYAPSTTERMTYDYDDWTQTMGHCEWIKLYIAPDMMLLENQIPFCVVKELFELLKIENESEKLLFTGGVELFRFLSIQMHDLEDRECNDVHHLLHLFYLSVGFPNGSRRQHHDRESLPELNKVQHLLHLLYLCVGFPDGSRSPHHDPEALPVPDLTQWVPSAKELEEAGVRFRKRRNATSFLDISFDYRRGVLEIPPLVLDDSSSALFRNLIAFEQTHPEIDCDISAYIGFMDCLVNTPEDMRILHLRGILVNLMNREQDASCFFSQVFAQVFIPADNYLAGLMQDISKYKDSRRHKWRAALVHNYFSNPWMTMSVFAAMILLILTFLQTVFTIYPYYKPSQRG